MKRFYLLVGLIISAGLCPGGCCLPRMIELPVPRLKGNVSLEEALNQRESVRNYGAVSLSLEEVSQVLWAAYGRNKWGKLTSPSAGAAYPLKIYLAAGDIDGVESGLYQYNNQQHSLLPVTGQDLRAALSEAALGQSFLRQAPALVIICADYEVTAARYGERAVRYVDMEAGHVSQNIYLQAAAMQLGTVAVGAFADEEVKKILGVGQTPLYIMPLGKKSCP